MKKKLKIIGLLFTIVCVFCTSYFYVYVNDYYEAFPEAFDVYQRVDYTKEGNYTILSNEKCGDTGIIFYPGAKVETEAYLPFLEKLVQKGYTCVLVEMPFYMAIFDVDRAQGVFDLDLDIDSWYMAGHSMGGNMASIFASDNQDSIDGLLLVGAYNYKEYPDEKTITIYGSFNDNLEKYVEDDKNVVVIEGGNHAQFGYYGPQEGDPNATISVNDQQDIAVDYIDEFISSK